MAGYNWSDPQTQEPGVLAAKGPDAIHFADIGPIVAQIMRMKENQAAQKRQDQADMIRGVGDLAKGAYAGYQTYETNQGEKAKADYMQHYTEAQAAGTPGGVSQAMTEDLARMTPEQKIDAYKFQIAQQERNASPSFASGPGGTSFIRDSKGGYHQVSGVGGAQGQGYREERDSTGQLWRVSPKGERVAVSDEIGKNFQTSDKTANEISSSVGVPKEKLTGLTEQDLTTPDVVQYYNKDYTQKYTVDEARKDPNAVVVLPNKTVVPFNKGLDAKGNPVPFWEKAAPKLIEHTRATQELQKDIDSRSAAKAAGGAFGGTRGINAERTAAQDSLSKATTPEQVAQIKAMFKSRTGVDL